MINHLIDAFRHRIFGEYNLVMLRTYVVSDDFRRSQIGRADHTNRKSLFEETSLWNQKFSLIYWICIIYYILVFCTASSSPSTSSTQERPQATNRVRPTTDTLYDGRPSISCDNFRWTKWRFRQTHFWFLKVIKTKISYFDTKSIVFYKKKTTMIYRVYVGLTSKTLLRPSCWRTCRSWQIRQSRRRWKRILRTYREGIVTIFSRHQQSDKSSIYLKRK